MRLLILVSLVVFSGGCRALQPRLPGSGRALTESRSLADFQEVELAGFGTVNVLAGQAPAVHVTTDDNLVQHVETTVVDGRLMIRPGRIKPKTGLQVDVTVPQLVAAKVSGAGDLSVAGVFGESLGLTVSGAGDIVADGQVQHVRARISGAGSADLSQLYAEQAEVRISGAGDVDVYASESVDAVVSGAGTVNCHGQPVNVSQRVSGAGSIHLR